MGLQSAFDQELSSIDATTLNRLRLMAIQQLKAATHSHRHPWHTGVVSSVEQGKPKIRTVVLRAVDDPPLKLRFHTDSRSTKIQQLQHNPEVEWLFYVPSTRIQLRVSAHASIIEEGERWSDAWNKTSLSSRKCYLGPLPPGTPTEGACHNLPDELLNRDPTQQESELGRSNFATVKCLVHSMEWLYLKHSGHLRCRFSRVEDNWIETWIAP